MRFKRLIELMFYISALTGILVMVVLDHPPAILIKLSLWCYTDRFFYFVFGFFISSSIVFYRNRIRVV